jgi:hypothetical protein
MFRPWHNSSSILIHRVMLDTFRARCLPPSFCITISSSALSPMNACFPLMRWSFLSSICLFL